MVIGMMMQEVQQSGDDEWLTSKEAAALLPMTSAPTLIRWAKSGKVEATRLPSGRYLFRRSTIGDLLKPAGVAVDRPLPGPGRVRG